jgi:cytochrome b561-like protein
MVVVWVTVAAIMAGVGFDEDQRPHPWAIIFAAYDFRNAPCPKMRSPDSNTESYDPTTIWLHWITVGLIVTLWVIGQTGDLVPRGPFRTGIWSVHVTLGFLTGFVLLTRVAWRALFGRVLRPADTGVLFAIAKITHYTL